MRRVSGVTLRVSEDHMLLQDLEPAGEGHEYRRADSRRTLIERIPDILVIHV